MKPRQRHVPPASVRAIGQPSNEVDTTVRGRPRGPKTAWKGRIENRDSQVGAQARHMLSATQPRRSGGGGSLSMVTTQVGGTACEGRAGGGLWFLRNRS